MTSGDELKRRKGLGGRARDLRGMVSANGKRQVWRQAPRSSDTSLVRYAAAEFGARGIRVNSILPGPVKTGITTPFRKQPEISELFLREIPMGRMGVPEDYARTVSFLAKPGFITGVNLPVSGGMHLYRVPDLPRYT